jgi:hypothetical protein
MTRTGTSHFVSFEAARRYYTAYGFDRDATLRKLQAGEIHIGEPRLAPGERLVIAEAEGRYVIEDSPPPARQTTLERFRDFVATARQDADDRRAMIAPQASHVAMRCAWWFIENVTEDDPERTDIFFQLREIVRSGQA